MWNQASSVKLYTNIILHSEAQTSKSSKNMKNILLSGVVQKLN